MRHKSDDYKLTAVQYYLVELKNNISKVLEKIPKEKYRNIFKGAYKRPEKYVSNKKTRKIKKNYL